MSNPVLNDTYWTKLRDAEVGAVAGSTTMTVQGAIAKTGILLALLMASLAWMWSEFWYGGHPVPGRFAGFMVGGVIAGMVAVLINMFAPRAAMVMGAIYALAEGLVLGGLTMVFQARYPGLPLLAACFTVATLLAMLLLYRTGTIKASSGFIRGVVAATGGLVLGMGLLWLLSMFGVGSGLLTMLYGNGPIGVLFSVFCVGLAALNLVIDFDFIERGAEQRLPKHMEWVAAIGLLVTLVWLYIEILRLLAKFRGRN
jgi:uncharacterized YccA/Bax inhibitor family protein